MTKKAISRMVLSEEIKNVLEDGKDLFVPNSRLEILHLAMGESYDTEVYEVAYDVPDVGRIVEATVTRCRNGLSVNYPEVYMRRRDPKAMLIADGLATDKERFDERYGKGFDSLRTETFEWLKSQERLIVMPYMAGGKEFGYPALLIAPINTGFFAGGLADLQRYIPANEIPEGFKPESIIFVAPHFRHTHLEGKQVVVHNRLEKMHEVFSYNLYPGPSAKKGVYGILLNTGEDEDWVTLHGSTVKVETPYDNTYVIMHEGASGGGKSEMLEQVHRDTQGRMLFAENLDSGEQMHVEIQHTCKLNPVTDDMAMCPPNAQGNSGKLAVTDAEDGWFLRVDHISEYGTEPHLEDLTIHPKEPLIFFNMDAKVGSTCLLWEHIQDGPNKPCPNPRVIVPRSFVDNIVMEPVEVDVRTFGVRTPPSSKNDPNYGVIGVFHVLPPALAWIWRLVAPRGHANPSIVDSKGMKSEGVGSYWPFATGRKVHQANLLLNQIKDNPNTKYKLIPNQHIGNYKVGFAGEWISREYLSWRGGAKFTEDKIEPARCSLFGYALKSLTFGGTDIPLGFLQVDKQAEVGPEAYDQGASKLVGFFKEQLQEFMTDELDPLGKQIIETFMNDGSVEDFEKLMPR